MSALSLLHFALPLLHTTLSGAIAAGTLVIAANYLLIYAMPFFHAALSLLHSEIA
jgi:hypothetical protein